jgi:hypothetical protein
MDPVQKMVNLAEREEQATTNLANRTPNPTERRKMLPTGTTVEEATKEKTDGGGGRPRLGHQVNS